MGINTNSNKQRQAVSRAAKKRWDEYRKKNPYVKVTNKTLGKTFTLDITREQLKEYREEHTVCEMCGKPETCITYTGNTGRKTPNQLAVDHDYTTGKFRGLLCRRCNCQFGWYELHKDMVEKYLNRKV